MGGREAPAHTLDSPFQSIGIRHIKDAGNHQCYDYVVETAHYRLVGEGLLGAKALLSNDEGECGDFAALFIALCRAKGIPAGSVVGYWAITGVEQTHVWAEFYIEGIGWIP